MRFTAASLYQGRHAVSFMRHPVSRRPGRFRSAGPVRPICCVRHGRPRHFAAEVTDKLRHCQCCPQVVPVVPDQSYPVRSSWNGSIDYRSADMWCSTGLSAWADLVHRVYSWPSLTHPAALPVAALHSRWRCWRTVHCTALHHHTWRRHLHVSPTSRTDTGSGPPPPNILTFQPAVGQQSEVVLFLLLVQRCGTAWQTMWHQLRRWRCSRTGSRRTCSVAATKLLDSEQHFLFPVISSPNPTVVLAIVLTI